MLSFLYPAFLIGAAAAAVPIVLHLLRRQAAPEVRFSAVRFLRQAPVEHTRRRRLRELLLLGLRVSALVLLAAAFARPYVAAGGGVAGSLTVVAVDRSFSMAPPARWDRARALARQAIDHVPAGSSVALLAFDDAPHVAAEPATGGGAARRALDQLQPGFGGTRYGPALVRAAALLGERPGRIVVVTDLQRNGWERGADVAVPDRVTVEVMDVGSDAANLGVLSLQRESRRTVVTVGNAAPAARASRVRVLVDGREIAAAPFTVGPGASVDVVLARALPPAGGAAAVVDDPGGSPADDARYLVLDPPPAPRILVLTAGGAAPEAFYLERALLAGGDAGGFDVDLVGGTAAATALADRQAWPAAIAILATRGVTRAGRDAVAAYLASGGGVLAAAGADVDPALIASLAGTDGRIGSEAPLLSAPLRLAPVDVRHPVFQPFAAIAADLGQIRFRRAWRLDEPDAQVVARFSDGRAALVERRVRSGRLLVFASDLANRWNDFPLHPAFVPFVHETMRYLIRDRRAPREYLVADVPAGVDPRPGIVSVGSPPRRIAVNVDPAESAGGRLTRDEFAAALGRLHAAAAVRDRDAAAETEAKQSYWRYGLMLMMVALVAEGVLATKAVV